MGGIGEAKLLTAEALTGEIQEVVK
jgi:hypothetical protein